MYIIDASIVKFALTYLHTGEYDDAEPSISRGLTKRGDVCSKSNAEEFGDNTDSSHADTLLFRSAQDRG